MSAEDKISSNVPLPEPVDEATGKVIDIHSKKVDEAAQFLAECGEYPPMTPEMEKKIIQKIDRWMIPMVSLNPSDSCAAMSLTWFSSPAHVLRYPRCCRQG